jgi:exosortase A-associated hydrolase 1
MTGAEEIPLIFACEGASLVGILHRPDRPKRRGVLIVVGAPQYRVGSHRQFVLLARDLARAGFPVLRFDYRGMGDSDGEFAGFEDVSADIRAAADCLFGHVEGLREVVLWGLCDGASAASFYAAGDARVGGLVVLNPWVRSGASVARARLSNYYVERLTSVDFWRNLLRRPARVGGALRGLAGSVAQAARTAEPAPAADRDPGWRGASATLPDRVGAALRRFERPTLVILSGADLTGQEFDGAVLRSRPMRRWRRQARVTIRRLDGANHTYATRAWREQVHGWIIEWLERF